MPAAVAACQPFAGIDGMEGLPTDRWEMTLHFAEEVSASSQSRITSRLTWKLAVDGLRRLARSRARWKDSLGCYSLKVFVVAAAMLQDGKKQRVLRQRSLLLLTKKARRTDYLCDMSQTQEVIILPRREGGRDYLPQPIVHRPGNHLGKWKPPRVRTMYTRVLALLDLFSLL